MTQWDNRFPSDAVKYACDLEEALPRELAAMCGTIGCRVSLAVNTLYPEIRGGYFLNWRIVNAIHLALDELRLHIVHVDYLGSDGQNMFPAEHLLSAEPGEIYRLLNNKGEIVSAMMKWQFSVGGGGPFFSDDLIIDFLLDDDGAARLVESVNRVFQECQIAVEQFTP